MLVLLLAATWVQASASTPPAPRWPVALPAERHGHRVAVVNGGLLSFGGFGDARAPDREQRQTWWLAPGAAEWVRRADMGAERAFFGSAVVNGTAYAIGESVERYDFERDAWSEVVAAGKLPRSHFGAAALGAELFVLGGYGASEAVLTVVDTATGAVRSEPPPPGFEKDDHFQLVHALRGELHVLGGLDGETFEPKREHWVRGEDGWRALPPTPAPLWAKFAAHAVLEERLFVFTESGAWSFSAESGKWRELAKLDITLAMPACVSMSGCVYVLGGMQVDRSDARVLMRYAPVDDRWRSLTPKAQ